MKPQPLLQQMNPSNPARQLCCVRPILACLALFLGSWSGVTAAESLFTVRQTFTITNLPPDADQVRGWFWMPEDRPGQRVLEFRIVEAPDSVRITRDPNYGRSWIYAEAPANARKSLRVVTEFQVARERLSGLADAERARPLTDLHRRTFAAELRRDEKHMDVTPALQRIGGRRTESGQAGAPLL